MPWRGAQCWHFNNPLLPLPAFPWWPLPVPCFFLLGILCAQLVSNEIPGFISYKSQVYCICCYLLIYANTIGLKKQKRQKRNEETDGYLCIQMVTLLSIKQWKWNVFCIYKRILVDMAFVVLLKKLCLTDFCMNVTIPYVVLLWKLGVCVHSKLIFS